LADLGLLIAASPRTAINYHLRGTAHEALGEIEAASADYRMARQVLTGSATALNNRAWELVTGPEATRDPEQALLLIRRAVELDPRADSFLNTLGVVQYRMGRDAEAITSLEKSLRLGEGRSDAFDLFFLSMAHARLGHVASALECFDRAVRWWDGRKDLPTEWSRDLTAFRAEAEVVLADAKFPSWPFQRIHN
jgi:tetratricopeptide (TPR) repeat protein